MRQVIFKTPSNEFAVDVLHTNIHVDRILNALGNQMIMGEHTTELMDTPHHVHISGDDSFGSVFNISVIQGHLILVASFGDDGDMVFSPTAPRGEMENDLPAELIELLSTVDNYATIVNPTIIVNSMGDYSIGQSFNVMDIN